MPALRRIGPSATTVCMVVQFGLATMPLWPSSASGFTSDTTSGTSSCMRPWEELSTTTAPPPANRAPPPLPLRAGREQRDVEALDCLVVERHDGQRPVAPRDRPPGRALRGERHH